MLLHSPTMKPYAGEYAVRTGAESAPEYLREMAATVHEGIERDGAAEATVSIRAPDGRYDVQLNDTGLHIIMTVQGAPAEETFIAVSEFQHRGGFWDVAKTLAEAANLPPHAYGAVVDVTN